MMRKRSCELCDRPYYSRGWCTTHYQRWAAHGDPTVRLPNRPRRLPAVCTVEGCGGKYHANSLCVVHWGRWKRLGDPLAKVELQVASETGLCTIEGCQAPHLAKGVCGAHYHKLPHRRAYRNTWRSNNKLKERYSVAKRRARKLKATPRWADQAAIEKFYADCPAGYEVDHILPLQGKEVCGLHVPWNLQYLTPSANRSKGNKVLKAV